MSEREGGREMEREGGREKVITCAVNISYCRSFPGANIKGFPNISDCQLKCVFAAYIAGVCGVKG